jgi:hypothetical protein
MLFFWLVGSGCIDYLISYIRTKLKYHWSMGSLQSKAAQIPHAKNGQNGIIVIAVVGSSLSSVLGVSGRFFCLIRDMIMSATPTILPMI